MRRRASSHFSVLRHQLGPLQHVRSKPKGPAARRRAHEISARTTRRDKARAAAFHQATVATWLGLRGATCRSTIGWGAGDAERYRRYAEELGALMPDVLLAGGGQAVCALATSKW